MQDGDTEEASRADQADPGAMADQGTQEAMAGQEFQAAMADQGTWETGHMPPRKKKIFLGKTKKSGGRSGGAGYGGHSGESGT